jgi:hypothetical protein
VLQTTRELGKASAPGAADAGGAASATAAATLLPSMMQLNVAHRRPRNADDR